MYTPRLLAPDRLDSCLEALRRAEIEAGNISSRGSFSTGYLDVFFEWHTETESSLAHLLSSTELLRLLYSPRFWALRQMNPLDSGARTWAEAEARERIAALSAAQVALQAVQLRWRQAPATIVVPDTNLLIHYGKGLHHIPWKDLSGSRGDVRVVLPLQVIDELDRHKRSNKPPVKARVRVILKELAGLNLVGSYSRATLSEEVLTKTTIEIFGQERDHVRLPDADSEIIEQAVIIGELADQKVIVLTSDLGMKIRAGDAEVDVRLIKTPEV